MSSSCRVQIKTVVQLDLNTKVIPFKVYQIVNKQNKYIVKAIISPTNKCLTKEQEQRRHFDVKMAVSRPFLSTHDSGGDIAVHFSVCPSGRLSRKFRRFRLFEIFG